MSKNKIKVLDRHFCNKLDRKQSNKKERQSKIKYVREAIIKVGTFKVDRTIPKIYVDEY